MYKNSKQVRLPEGKPDYRSSVAFDNVCAWLNFNWPKHNCLIQDNGNNNKLSKLFYLALKYQHH